MSAIGWATVGAATVAVLGATGLVAAVGSYLVARFTSRKDHEQWLRQERKTVYAEIFIKLIGMMKLENVEGTETSNYLELHMKAVDLTRHWQTVKLIGTPEVADALKEVINAFSAMSLPVIRRFEQRDAYMDAIQRYHAAVVTFEDASIKVIQATDAVSLWRRVLKRQHR